MIAAQIVRIVRRQLIQPLAEPRSNEKKAANEKARQNLPKALRLPQQTCGITNNSCGATHSIMERCNFACTSCYLSDIANATDPLPFEEVRQQLDTLRAFLGPAGKAQITSGEVTLLDIAALGRIVAYARRIGLDPMLMTNGQRLLEIPDYLLRLVRDFELEKIGIHVDTTQLGRKERRPGSREPDLNPVRDRFASMIRAVRTISGKTLRAAHTLTITEANLDDVPDVVRWSIRNADSFRMVSFQPVAEVGRTQDRAMDGITLDSVWEKICAGIGYTANRHAMYFGHPKCNIVVPLVVIRSGEFCVVVESVRHENAWDERMFRRLLTGFGGFTTVNTNPWQAALKIVSLMVRSPTVPMELIPYTFYRLWGLRRILAQLCGNLIRFRGISVRPLIIVVHRFMGQAELGTPEGRERLAACVFKLPVSGDMVSMCEMNATSMRKTLNQRQLKTYRVPRVS